MKTFWKVYAFLLPKVLGVLVGVLVAFVLVVAGQFVWWLVSRAASPTPASHVASDCRAACTLEGLAFVGVEVTPLQHSDAIRCLCAPFPEDSR